MFGINPLYSGKNLPVNKAVEYGPFPKELKVQLVFIFKDFINNLTDTWGRQDDIPTVIWNKIDGILRRVHGLHVLYDDYHSIGHRGLASWYMVCQYFEGLENIDKQLDVVCAVCQQIDNSLDPNLNLAASYTPQQAFADINARLQQHGTGYKYEAREIIKIPAEFNYQQSIQPALILLTQNGFENAQQELLNAFKHYKKGPEEYEEALVNCLKAIESTIKIIAKARGWEFTPNDTAKDLIKVILDNGLVPNYSVNFLSGIRNTLESGVPTLRNKMGGHGKGAEVRIVDEPSMHYCINLTASVILYLAQRHQLIP